jgi:hypothetical protein
MSFVRGYQNATGLASATSANGVARNGATLPMNTVQPGTLIIECVGNVKTSSVVATYKVQVSVNGSTWRNLEDLINATPVATASGTGSDVAHDFSLCVPQAASAYPYVRGVATLSGASTASDDVTAVTYRFLRYGLL